MIILTYEDVSIIDYTMRKHGKKNNRFVLLDFYRITRGARSRAPQNWGTPMGQFYN